MLWELIKVAHGSMWALNDKPPNTGPFRQSKTWCHQQQQQQMWGSWRRRVFRKYPAWELFPAQIQVGLVSTHPCTPVPQQSQPITKRQGRGMEPWEGNPAPDNKQLWWILHRDAWKEESTLWLSFACTKQQHPRKKRTGHVEHSLDSHLWILTGEGLKGSFR